MNHLHPSCKPEHATLAYWCARCGQTEDASAVADALRTLLDAVEGNRVTVGDCIQAKKALDSIA